jgi:antitoxin HicB
MKYHFKVHQEGKIYWAECLELEGCNTQAHSKSHLQSQMKEALHLYLDEPDTKRVFPSPDPSLKGRKVVEVAVDAQVAWAISLRNARLNRGMTQREVAKSLKMKSVFAYQKMESSKTANPELATIIKIKQVFPELKLDELLSA